MMSEQQYQSLYRRFRPQRFSELRGQEHVVLALRNAVKNDRVAHAYLFSGPRGTGKTSTARILAKALNCIQLNDGEPCGICDSCRQVQQGSSLDVHELDAASNNGVDAMRDLVSRAALGSPGRWKVYIVDEVHMLSTAASNALLKTLEEPPGHVVFVLATTDPQKVLPTIRSRTQHFEFHLLSVDTLGELLKEVNDSAGLGVAPEAIDLVVRRGHGSARDALSVLDQVAAAGTVQDETEVIEELVNALVERDAARAMVAVAEGMRIGRDPRRLTNDVLAHLRDCFLASMARSLVELPDEAAARAEEQARQMGTPSLVRAMEILGDALVDMREAVDPRITLEVALIRIARPEAESSPAAMLERIDRLERSFSSGTPVPAPASSPNRVVEASLELDAPATPSGGAAQARAALGALRKTEPTASPPARTAVSRATERVVPSRDELTEAWGDLILDNLPQRAKARFRVGRFVSVDGNVVTFALPNAIHRDRCNELRGEVEEIISAHFGTGLSLDLVVDRQDPTSTGEEDEHVDLAELKEAPASAVSSPEERVRMAFPGAEEITS